jgi:glycosyltransferase involved in cell wall biosynthesis
MKIAVWHNLPSGGGSRALHYHIKGLSERGHHVEVWSPPTADNEYLNVGQYVRKTHVVPMDEMRQEPSLKEKLGYFFYKTDQNAAAMMSHCQQCIKEIEQNGFDVLFAGSCKIYAVPYIARFDHKIPTVLYLGEPLRHLYEAKNVLPWGALDLSFSPLRRSHWITWWLDLWTTSSHRVQVREEQRNYLSFSKILVNSFYSSEACVRVYGQVPEVCYLGINTHLFRNLLLQRENLVVGLGNLYPNKNPLLAVEAVGAIPKEERPKIVWIANMVEEHLYQKIQDKVQELNIDFELKTLIGDEELVTLLNRAKVFVYTSRLEPFGLAPLEANACGLPVVANAEGGVRETVLHEINGLLVAQKPKEMGIAIAKILKDNTLWQNYSSNALSHIADNWSLESCVDRIEDALIEVVEK